MLYGYKPPALVTYLLKLTALRPPQHGKQGAGGTHRRVEKRCLTSQGVVRINIIDLAIYSNVPAWKGDRNAFIRRAPGYLIRMLICFPQMRLARGWSLTIMPLLRRPF